MTLAPWKKSYDQPESRLKKQRHHFVDKDPYSQSYDFSSSQVQISELDDKKRLSAKEMMLLNCGDGEDF